MCLQLLFLARCVLTLQRHWRSIRVGRAVMIVVFRCSAHHWLLFVVEPLAVFTVSPCVYVRVYQSLRVHAHLRVWVLCVCGCVSVCVCRGQGILCLLRCASAVCDLQLHSFMSLFPTVCSHPASRLIFISLHPPLSRQPPLSSLFLPLFFSHPTSLSGSCCPFLHSLVHWSWKEPDDTYSFLKS